LGISKKEAFSIIESGQVAVNEAFVNENVFFKKTDAIYYKDTPLQESMNVLNIAFYKPRGIETTLNDTIPDNLNTVLPFKQRLFPVGRLDKDSEGLLLLTNDGQIYRNLNHYGTSVEKEYVVTVNQVINDDFIQKMSSGVEIMGKMTLPCKVTKIDDTTFNIILIQGLNRQIRRMCYKLDYEVLTLKRIRIGDIKLKELKANEYYVIEKSFI
jgi:23S rRNA pseudouridine2604 synthase